MPSKLAPGAKALKTRLCRLHPSAGHMCGGCENEKNPCTRKGAIRTGCGQRKARAMCEQDVSEKLANEPKGGDEGTDDENDGSDINAFDVIDLGNESYSDVELLL